MSSERIFSSAESRACACAVRAFGSVSLSHCVLSGELGLSGFLPTVVCLERETRRSPCLPLWCDALVRRSSTGPFPWFSLTHCHAPVLALVAERSTLQPLFTVRTNAGVGCFGREYVISVSTRLGDKTIDTSRALWYKRGLHSRSISSSHVFPSRSSCHTCYGDDAQLFSRLPSLLVSRGYCVHVV